MNLPLEQNEAVSLLRNVMNYNPEAIFDYDADDLFAIFEDVQHGALFNFMEDVLAMITENEALFDSLNTQNVYALIMSHDETRPLVIHHIDNYISGIRNGILKRTLKGIRDRIQGSINLDVSYHPVTGSGRKRRVYKKK